MVQTEMELQRDVNTNIFWTGLGFNNEHVHKSCKSKMAAKPKGHKSKDGSKPKENKRWIFDDGMTASLVECLQNYKVDKEGEGIDFEGDLVKLCGHIRVLMASKYDETNFGPVQLHAS